MRFFLLILLLPASVFAEPAVKFGALFHLTGEFAIQGKAFREGAELAVAEINEGGGIKGTPLRVVFEDTQYKPLPSVSAAKKLTSDPAVTGLLISTITEAKSAANIIEKNKLPSIVLWDSSPELDAMGDFIFSIGPWAPASGEVSANFARHNLDAKTAVIINVQTEWSVYVSRYFAESFKALGGEVLEQFSLDPNDQDARTILLKTRSLKPDVIYAPIDSNIFSFFKQLNAYRLTIPVLTSDIIDKELLDAGAGFFEGIYQSQSVVPDSDESTKLIQNYRKKFGHEPDYLMYTAWAYDGIKLLAEAAGQSGNKREQLKDALYKIKDHAGASGQISFNPNGSAPRKVKIFQVSNNKLTLVR